MRESVLTIAVVCGGCVPNPAFMLAGEADEGRASTGGESTTADDGSTGAQACAPVVETPVEDVCEPFLANGIQPPDLADQPMLSDYGCDGSPALLDVMRKDQDTLVECPGCEPPCLDDRTMSVSLASMLPEVGPLLPQVGECARLWHKATPTPGDQLSECRSIAYAMWDLEPPGLLRLAVASEEDDPFAGVPGLDLEAVAKQGASTLCPLEEPAEGCIDGSVEALELDFEFGECRWTAVQGERWSEIVVDDLRFRLDVYRAYNCINGQRFNIGWYLRRAK